MRLASTCTVLLLTLPIGDELVEKKTRSKIVAAAGEIAKLGDAELVDEVARLLEEAGEGPEQVTMWREKRWNRALSKAKTPPKDKTRRSAARRVEGAVKALEAELASAGESETAASIAELMLSLDSRSEAAHLALGHVEFDGRYLDEGAAWMAKRSREIEGAIREAMALEIDCTHVSPSPSKLVREMTGGETHAVSAWKVTLHGGVSPDRLERALSQGLRALAFSNWLLHGEVALPEPGKLRGDSGSGFEYYVDAEGNYQGTKVEILFTEDLEKYEEAWKYCEENGRLTPETLAFKGNEDLVNFQTSNDLRVHQWTTEGRIAAQVVYFGSVLRSPEPFLFAGHINWLCLRFLGVRRPTYFWLEEHEQEARSTIEARSDDGAIWRAASSGLIGARSYLKRKIEKTGKVSLVDSIVDDERKLGGVPLLAATIVCEYLQVARDWSKLHEVAVNADESRLGAAERALGETIPEFDAKWNAYLLGRSEQSGVLQRVLGEANDPMPERDPVGEATLKHLKGLREAAFQPLSIWAEELELYADLSAKAQAHAAYLQLNEEQKSAWPDCHEEYPDCEGFSPEGAWSGGHSVIAFDGDAVLAIDAWMATFYHRLPLLEPGLCGIGVAVNDDVVVLDSGSLLNNYSGEAHVCWPHASQRNVPRSFRPELPNPVPGEDQTSWGYPITVQSYWNPHEGGTSVALELFIDGSDDPVDCHYISPSNAPSKMLRPKDAYCLIPKAKLKAKTTYRVVAKIPGSETEFSWTFKTGTKDH